MPKQGYRGGFNIIPHTHSMRDLWYFFVSRRNGWIVLDVEDDANWDEIEELTLFSYQHFELKRMSKELAGHDTLLIIEVQFGDRNAAFACDRIKQVNIVILDIDSGISQLIHVSIGNASNRRF